MAISETTSNQVANDDDDDDETPMTPAQRLAELQRRALTLKEEQAAAERDAKELAKSWEEIRATIDRYKTEHEGLDRDAARQKAKTDDAIERLQEALGDEIATIRAEVIEPYDARITKAEGERDELKGKLETTTQQLEQAHKAAQDAKSALDRESGRLAAVKADLKAAVGHLAQADAKYDQELHGEAYIHASEQLKKAVERAEKALVDPDDFESKIQEAWEDWFAKKENARALEQQLAQERRALEKAEADLQKLEKNRIEALLAEVRRRMQPQRDAA